MKTIRLTWIALSIAALLVGAIAPAASAACTVGAYTAACLNGIYAFRLDPATGFDANLAAYPGPSACTGASTPWGCCTGPGVGATCPAGDPGNVHLAPAQNVMQSGEFTANGSGGITAGETFATIDDQYGDTDLIDFTWGGTYTVSSDGTGTLSASPSSSAYWKCYDLTNPAGPPDWTQTHSYLSWPNQIMPVLKNAGNFVYQPVTPPDWVASSYYKDLYTSSVQIFPTLKNTGNNAFRRSAVQAWSANTYYPVGFQVVPAAANNPGGYVFQVTTAGTSSLAASEPNPFNQTVGGTQLDGSVTWTNENGILGKTGASEPTWPSTVVSFTANDLLCTASGAPWACCTGSGAGSCPPPTGGFVTDGGIMWMNEGPYGTSGAKASEPTWAQTGQITNDQGITWAFLGNSPLTPVACTSTWESAETYSTSLSASHGALEMDETDNSGGPGAKIFMTGEAVKR